MTSDGSGPNLQGSWASYDQSTSSWKTYQGCLFGDFQTFSGTWPSSGTMRNGVVFQRPQWVPPISESESSLWPTPRANKAMAAVITEGADPDRYPNLETVVKKRDPSVVGGALNPMWIEWMMGFPLGWTDLEDSATPSCPK